MLVNSSQILKGNLESCVLKIISKNDMYGYEITEQLSKFGLSMVAQGTIYPLLLKLEKEKLLTSYLKDSDSGPPRKYYKITDVGRQYLQDFLPIWQEINTAITKILMEETNNEEQ